MKKGLNSMKAEFLLSDVENYSVLIFLGVDLNSPVRVDLHPALPPLKLAKPFAKAPPTQERRSLD